MNPCHIMKRYARCREKAYTSTGRFTSEKAKAVTRILRVAGFFSGKNDKQQYAAVRMCKQDLLLILPTDMSRYSKQREQIINLINIGCERPFSKSIS